MSRPGWIAAAFVSFGLLASACSNSNGSASPPPSPIPVASAAASADGTQVTVAAGLVAPSGAPVTVCEAMTLSIPPQCVGDGLEVDGLDLSTVPHASTDAGVTWSPQVTVTGTMQGGKLTGATVVANASS